MINVFIWGCGFWKSVWVVLMIEVLEVNECVVIYFYFKMFVFLDDVLIILFIEMWELILINIVLLGGFPDLTLLSFINDLC